MIIGVVSDTHVGGRIKSLPKELLDGLRGVDLIIHAGDILKDFVIYELEEIAPVEAVAGNNDDYYMQHKLGVKKIINAGKFKIGITHGYGGVNALKKAMATFARDSVDCVVFGHSHAPYNERIDGVLYVNPGSPTDKRFQKQYSYALLKVDDSGFRRRLNIFSSWAFPNKKDEGFV